MPVVIAVLLALLWVFALRRWYRQAPTPLESVEHQQRALDALQHAASRSRSGPPAPPGAAGRPLSFSLPRGGRSERSLAPFVVALVGTLVLAGVGAIWWVGTNTNQKQASSSSTVTTGKAATTTTAPPTTTTTAPPAPTVAHATLARQAGASVVYNVDRQTYTVAISASAPCWVRVQDPNNQNGTPLFEGTLHSGANQPIPINGSAMLRLGAANNVTLTLDGQPLQLPGQSGNTLTLTFNGSTNGA